MVVLPPREDHPHEPGEHAADSANEPGVRHDAHPKPNGEDDQPEDPPDGLAATFRQGVLVRTVAARHLPTSYPLALERSFRAGASDRIRSTRARFHQGTRVRR